MSVFVYVTCVCMYPQRSDKSIRFPKAELMGDCEPSIMDAGNKICILWKNKGS